jgi:cytochrome c peroxidase
MTGEARDMGRFKAPSLRNIAVTAPYMHDGSIATLQEVIEHYQRGGRLIVEGTTQGDGRLSPFRSEFVAGFDLEDGEAEELLAFLLSLSDESALTNERWSNPHRP